MMSNTNCPQCGRALEDGANSSTSPDLCPHCGKSVTPTAPKGAPPPQVVTPPCKPHFSKLAITSFALGLLPFLIIAAAAYSAIAATLAEAYFWRWPVLLQVLIGLTASVMGLERIQRTSSSLRGESLARIGIALHLIVLVLFFLLAPLARETVHRPNCAKNLKILNLVMKMFSHENPQGWYPELSPTGGRLMFVSEIFPEYFTDPWVLVCPADKAVNKWAQQVIDTNPTLLIDDQSYFYLGYLVTNDMEMRGFAEAYKERIARGERFDGDLDVPMGQGFAGGNKIHRLREGIEQLLANPEEASEQVRNLQARIPLMWDRATLAPGEKTPKLPHPRNSMNVVYMDGHVTAIEQGQWPYTEETLLVLHDLDSL